MEIIKRYLGNNQYLHEPEEKKSIILHHTAGSTADGAISWWNQTPDRVGVAYVLDRDGKIYEVFDPSNWAFHIGINGDDNFYEKHSIGIEIVGLGHVEKIEGKFRFCPFGVNNKVGQRIVPSEDVIELKAPYRGQKYFHKYTDAQIKALDELIRYLVKTFKITLQTETLEETLPYYPKLLKTHDSGIYTHGMFRNDKDDIYPDTRLLDMVNKIIIEKSNTKKNP